MSLYPLHILKNTINQRIAQLYTWHLLFVALFFCLNFYTSFGQSDSTTLTYKEYLTNIINYHPIAKQADLKLKIAKAEMLGAKGNLDPTISSDWNQKNFDNKLYYRQYQAKLKIPTPLGIDIVGGYENTDGVFLNPENKTSNYGLWHLGLEVNVLQGFLINTRRTSIQKAKVFQKLAKNEQQIILNDLIYNASVSYLIWQQYENFNEVMDENITNTNTYFKNTKLSFFSGEKTAMDTLEAFILYQDAVIDNQRNGLGLIKSRQNIENYLWYLDIPVTLQEYTKPENFKNQMLPSIKAFENSDLLSHPILLSSINKLSFLEIEQKLKREKLKPKLKLKYNPLFGTSQTSLEPNFSINNYKWGFDFSMPLLLMSERANIKKGKIKLLETKLEIENKQNELKNKIESSWEQIFLLQKQLILLDDNVKNYKQLLNGENEKFNYGESSVFLLNKRQEKYINGRLKLIKSYINKQIELLNFLYFSNQLLNE